MEVVLVGASVRWAAQSCLRAGISVVGIDHFGDQDTRLACSRHLYRDVNQSVTEQTNRYADAKNRPLLFVGGLCGERETNGLETSTLQTLARLAGLKVPQTVASRTSLLPRGEGWLIKERQSSGGLGVRWLSGTKGSSAENVILQKWIPGHSIGLVFLADRAGVRMMGASRSLSVRLGDRPVVYAGSRGPIAPNLLPLGSLNRLAEFIVEETGIRGLFNLDCVIDRRGDCHVLELNARPSASCEVLEWAATDTEKIESTNSLMKLHINAIFGGSPTQTMGNEFPLNPGSYLKRIVYSNRPGIFEPQQLSESDAARMKYADVPFGCSEVGVGDPLMTLLMRRPKGVEFRRSIRVVQSFVIGRR